MPHATQYKKGEFQRAVLRAAYRSPQQRRRRVTASIILFGKYFFGGVLLLWPLSLILIGAVSAADPHTALLFVLLAFPGMVAWMLIFLTGARKDYDRLVRDQILTKGFMRRLH